MPFDSLVASGSHFTIQSLAQYLEAEFKGIDDPETRNPFAAIWPSIDLQISV